MNKRTKQNTGYDSPVNSFRGFTTGSDKQNLNSDNGQNKSDIDNFNYEYNKSAKVYKTGEQPQSGVYVCSNCGNDVIINQGSNLPSCPRCSNLEFYQKNELN
ncbi:MAG: hypothetical protein PHE12_02365 [Clostridia bacterium]|nr:hypothetical protein [Clostridia bacterium]